MVGSNQGQVHSERQGTGLATVLQGDRAYIEGQKQLGQYQLDKKAKQTELKTRRDLAFKQLNDFHPEYWDKDNAAIQSELDALVDEGGKLIAMSKSGDPFTDVTPEALAFQKKFNLVRGLAQKSKQAMAEDIAIRAELKGKEVSDYSAKDLAAYGDWLETPIYQRGQAPIIGKAAPLYSLSKESGVLAKTLSDQFGDNPIGEGDVFDAVKDQMSDPKFADGIAKAASQAYLSLSPEEQEMIKNAADMSGIDPVTQIYGDMVMRRTKIKKAFTPIGFIDDIARGVNVVEMKTGGQYGVRTSYDDKAYKIGLLKRAFAATLDDPRAVQDLIGKGLIDSVGDEYADREAAAQYYADQADLLVKKPTIGTIAYKKSESELGKAEDIAKSNEWYSQITSGNLAQMQAAANEMPLRKMPDGRTIESASVFTQMQPDGASKNFLAVRLEPTKEIGKAGLTGITPEMLDNERLRLKATTGGDETSLMTPEEKKKYDSLPAGTGKGTKGAFADDIIKTNLVAPKFFVELAPGNENLLKNLYNPEQKAMTSAYSPSKGGGLWGGLPKKTVEAKSVEKKRF